MPKVKVNDITMNYESQGAGEPLVLIPFLAADHACYAFQVADYAKHFTCISIDLRGAGETDKPAGTYSTELFADDVAAFMQAIGVEKAHVSGVSLGAATGMWLAAKYPQRVKSLSLHSGWTKSDPFLKAVVAGWQSIAKGLGSVPDGRPGHLHLVLHAGALCGETRLYRATRRFRAQPAAAAARRLHPPIECGDGP